MFESSNTVGTRQPTLYAYDRYGLLITVGGVGGDFSQTQQLGLFGRFFVDEMLLNSTDSNLFS